MTQALHQGLARRDQRLRDMARALPRVDSLLDTPRQRLDRHGARLGPALMTGVQRRKIRLADASGSLRPAALKRTVETETRRLNDRAARLTPALSRAITAKRDRFDASANRFQPERLVQDRQKKADKLADVSRRLSEAGARQLGAWQTKVEALGRLNETLSYKATLDRGFVVVRSNGAVITDSETAKTAASLEIQFADGRVTVGGKQTARKAASKPPEQGSLF